jgi:hypothetical protein
MRRRFEVRLRSASAFRSTYSSFRDFVVVKGNRVINPVELASNDQTEYNNHFHYLKRYVPLQSVYSAAYVPRYVTCVVCIIPLYIVLLRIPIASLSSHYISQSYLGIIRNVAQNKAHQLFIELRFFVCLRLLMRLIR